MESGKKPGRTTIPCPPGARQFSGESDIPDEPGEPDPDVPEETEEPDEPEEPDGPHDVPQTGDAKEQALWGALLAIPAAGAAATLALSKKKRYRGKHAK